MRGMILAFLQSNWLGLINSAGVIAAIWMSISNRRQQSVDVHFAVKEGHERIWNDITESGRLGRIKRSKMPT